jgi:hypothetical protein
MSQQLPYLPPQPGTHHAGRTVVPMPKPLPVVVVPHQQLPVPVPAEPAPSELEAAARVLAEAVAEPIAPAAPPVAAVPERPRTAAACMTILPR